MKISGCDAIVDIVKPQPLCRRKLPSSDLLNVRTSNNDRNCNNNNIYTGIYIAFAKKSTQIKQEFLVRIQLHKFDY